MRAARAEFSPALQIIPHVESTQKSPPRLSQRPLLECEFVFESGGDQEAIITKIAPTTTRRLMALFRFIFMASTVNLEER
jgi:hypothetical protein